MKISSVKAYILGLIVCTLSVSPYSFAEEEATAPPEISPTTNSDVSTTITTGDGYDAWTGSVRRVVHDIYPVPGAIGYGQLAFTRTYSSWYSSNPSSPTFPGWSGSYAWQMTDQNGVILVTFPDGRRMTFDGSHEVPSGESFTRSTRGTKERLSQNWNGPANEERDGDFDLYLEDGSIAHFKAHQILIGGGGGDPEHFFKYFESESIEDPHGLITTFTYTPIDVNEPWNARLTQVTDPTKRWLKFTYSGPVLQKVEASDGQSVIYAATGSGDSLVQTATYSDGTHATYTYVGTTTTNGGTTYCLKTADDTHAEGPMRSILYKYQAAPKPNFGGQILSECYPDGTAVSTYTHTDTAISEQRGDGSYSRTFTIIKDDNTPLMKDKSDFMLRKEYFTYDAFNYLDHFTDFRGNLTVYTNEEITGRPLTITHPASMTGAPFSYGTSTTSYNYGPDPSIPYYVYSVTDERGKTTSYDRYPQNPVSPDWHSWKQRIKTIYYPHDAGDPVATETFEYNGLGEVTKHKKTNGYYEHSFYFNTQTGDILNSSLLQQVSNPTLSSTTGSEWTSYEYYTSGPWVDRVMTMTDPRGNSITYEYDRKYDGSGAACAGRGLVTKITYEDDKHPGESPTYTNGTTQLFTYDAWGNKTSETNELTKITTYGYDNYNRLTSVKLPDTALISPQPPTTYDYTPPGHSPYSHTTKSVTLETSPAGVKTAKAYDANFRLSVKTEGSQDPTIAATTRYDYDENGNQTVVVDPRGLSLADNDHKTTTIYDSRNRKTQLTTPPAISGGASFVTKWKYDAAGNVIELYRPDQTPAEVKTYDAMNRLLSDRDPMLRSTTFTYYPSGTMHTVTDANSHTTTFVYNGFDLKSDMTYQQVDGQTGQDSEHWDYDGNKNLINHRTVNGSIQKFEYDARNRKTKMYWTTSVDSSTFHYDAAGHLNSAQNPYSTITRNYDEAGRLLLDRQTLPTVAATPIPSIALPTVVSRRTHGAAGTFDIALPLTGAPGIESRSGGSYQIVATFPTSVTCGAASVISGIGHADSNNTSGSEITIYVSGVSNAQRLVVKLPVQSGSNSADVFIPMNVLIGDNAGNSANGTVNASDLTYTKNLSGTTTTAQNFRADVNASGIINGGDETPVKVYSGTNLPTVAPDQAADVSYEYDADSRMTRLYIPSSTYDFDHGYDGLGRLKTIIPSTTYPYYQYGYDKTSNVTARTTFLNATTSVGLVYTPDNLNRIKDLTINVPSQKIPTTAAIARTWFTKQHYYYDEMNRLTGIQRDEDQLWDHFDTNNAGELIQAQYGAAATPTPTPRPSATPTATPTPTPTATPKPRLPQVVFSDNAPTASGTPAKVTMTCPGATKILYTDSDSTPANPTHDASGTPTGDTEVYNPATGALVPHGYARNFKAIGFNVNNTDSVVMPYSVDNTDDGGGLNLSAIQTQFALADDGDTDAFAEVDTNVRTVLYGLDACGNRRWTAVNGVTSGGYIPNELNQYDIASNSSVVNGSEHEIFQYNGSRYYYLGDTYLSEVYSGPDIVGNPQTQATYDYLLGYDALGRCVRRTLNNQTVLFVYDGEHPILEFDPNGQNASSNIYGRGIDEILARSNHGSGQYMLQDRLGSVIAVVGGAGLVAESYTYDVYGAVSVKKPDGTTPGNNMSTINNRFLFTGREYVPQYIPQFGGFYEYRARAYRPGLGRFMSEDPKGCDARLASRMRLSKDSDPLRPDEREYNLYRYCGNDPLDFSDPMGLYVTYSDDWSEADAKNYSVGFAQQWSNATQRARMEGYYADNFNHVVSPDRSSGSLEAGATKFSITEEPKSFFRRFIQNLFQNAAAASTQGSGNFEKMRQGDNTAANNQARDAAREVGLKDKDQLSEFHDAIHGQKLTYKELKQIAQEIKDARTK